MSGRVDHVTRETDTETVTGLLRRARAFAAAGDDEVAKQAYLLLLRRDPSHVRALIELGALAETTGYRTAARSAYQEAVLIDPSDPFAQTGLANVYREAGDLVAARAHYEAALAAAPGFARAHQGLGQTLLAIEHPEAAHHLRAGFVGHAVVRQRYRGPGAGIPLVLLVSGRGGNVATSHWIDNRRYAVTAICADFQDPDAPLPPHAVIVNAIGDADLCGDALSNAERMVARTTVPVINHPARVRLTGRQETARRLASMPGVVAPMIAPLDRGALAGIDAWRFPLLLRSPGWHTGQHFVRVDTHNDLASRAATLPGETLLAIAYLDARGADGMARKYRVMFIDGAMYPLHLAISPDWKVHYFSAAMEQRPDFRDEERGFLEDMTATLGARAIRALADIGRALGLDYGGIDFGLAGDGSILLFEANATMVINPVGPDPMWAYRRAPIAAAIDAARRMVDRRHSQCAGTHTQSVPCTVHAPC